MEISGTTRCSCESGGFVIPYGRCRERMFADDETPETRFYVLDALAQDTQPVTGARGASPIVIDLTSVPFPNICGVRRLSSVSANRLVLSEFDNWGGSLEKHSALYGEQSLHSTGHLRHPCLSAPFTGRCSGACRSGSDSYERGL